MDYIKQLNAFYSRLEYCEPLSANAIALWNALLHIANRSGWQEHFTVANKTLEVKSGLEISSLKRARNELIQKGLLVYVKGTGRHVHATYSIPVLYGQVSGQVNNLPVQYEPVSEQVKTRANKPINSLPVQYGPVSEPVEYLPVQYGPVSEPVSEPVGEPVSGHSIKHKQNENEKQRETRPRAREPANISAGAAAPSLPDSLSTFPDFTQPTNAFAPKPSAEEQREKYGEYGWVRLSKREIERLLTEYGQDITSHYIAVVDELAQQTGNKNKWKDWNLTVRKAIRNKWGSTYQGGSAPKNSEYMEHVRRL